MLNSSSKQIHTLLLPSSRPKRLTKEPEHVVVVGGLERGVGQEAVPVGAGLVAPVRRLYEERHGAVLQLIAHLRYGLAVSAAAVVYTLTWQEGKGRVGLISSMGDCHLWDN